MWLEAGGPHGQGSGDVDVVTCGVDVTCPGVPGTRARVHGRPWLNPAEVVGASHCVSMPQVNPETGTFRSGLECFPAATQVEVCGFVTVTKRG